MSTCEPDCSALTANATRTWTPKRHELVIGQVGLLARSESTDCFSDVEMDRELRLARQQSQQADVRSDADDLERLSRQGLDRPPGLA